MRAILIDPETKTFTEVQHNGDYRNIYKLIEADYFEVVNMRDDHGSLHNIFCDEEGLLKDDPQYFWKIDHFQPIAGKALVLGTEDKGEDGIDSGPATVSLGELTRRIKFMELKLEGFESFEGTVNHPVLGPNTPMIGQRPIFRKREKA